jgi:hypothetical protein
LEDDFGERGGGFFELCLRFLTILNNGANFYHKQRKKYENAQRFYVVIDPIPEKRQKNTDHSYYADAHAHRWVPSPWEHID